MSAAEFKTGRWHDGERWVSVIYRLGTKRAIIVNLSSDGVRVDMVPKEEERHITPLLYWGDLYPLERAVKRFRRIGKILGISSSAKAELERAVAP